MNWSRRSRLAVSAAGAIVFGVITTYERFEPDGGVFFTVPAPYVHAVLMMLIFGTGTYFLFPPCTNYFYRRILDRKASRIERARRQGVCHNCGYDLRGLAENRCPECGTPFEPGGERIGAP